MALRYLRRPNKPVRKSLPFIVFFSITVFACAGKQAVQPPAPVVQSQEKNAEFLNQLRERMHEEEEAFEALYEKMDEYQTLMAACERLADTKENRSLRASCKERLKALKEELTTLSRFLQDQPE